MNPVTDVRTNGYGDTLLDERSTSTFPDVLLRTMSLHYGVYVSHCGEDGEMFALGHGEQRRVIAAFHAEERIMVRLHSFLSTARPLATFTGRPIKAWATCESRGGDDWFVDWSADEDTEGAFPVTLWKP